MMEIWFLHLMKDSITVFKNTGNNKCLDIVESTPFGLLETVFGDCTTIADVEKKCEYIYSALELCRDVILDTDSDWVE